MNRADLLYSVLKDGEPHTRRDIQRRVGYFLTNNAASELRKRGTPVTYHHGRYQLVAPSSASPGDSSSGAVRWSEPGLATASGELGSSTTSPHAGGNSPEGPPAPLPGQLTIEEAA